MFGRWPFFLNGERMKKGIWILSLLWLGCVGDDGTEVIGSYAPPGDTTSSGTQSGGESSEESTVEDASSTPDGEQENEPDVVQVEDATTTEDVQAEDVQAEDVQSEDVQTEDILVDASEPDDVLEDATEDGLAGDAGDALEAGMDADVTVEDDAADDDVLDEDAADGETGDTNEDNELAFGETCTQNAECETKLCLEVPSGFICSSYCVD